jgi:hypothetical protein
MNPYVKAVEDFVRPLMSNQPITSWVVSDCVNRPCVVSVCVGLPDQKRTLELFRGNVELDYTEKQKISNFISAHS